MGLTSFFTLNKTSKLCKIIEDEWAHHHFEENQAKFRESEVFSNDGIEDETEMIDEVLDFIEQQSTFYPSIPDEEL